VVAEPHAQQSAGGVTVSGRAFGRVQAPPPPPAAFPAPQPSADGVPEEPQWQPPPPPGPPPGHSFEELNPFRTLVGGCHGQQSRLKPYTDAVVHRSSSLMRTAALAHIAELCEVT